MKRFLSLILTFSLCFSAALGAPSAAFAAGINPPPRITPQKPQDAAQPKSTIPTTGKAANVTAVPSSATAAPSNATVATPNTPQSSALNLNVKAKSVVLVDAATGTVMYEQKKDEKLPLASVTKVMTMLLICEALDSGKITLKDVVTTSDYAAGMGGSQVYLKPGEKMTVDKMLKAVAVASGNDASVALAEHVAGSIDGFVQLMNKRAQELGMRNTNFANCTGLDDPTHHSTAADIAIMSRELLKHAAVTPYLTTWMDTLRDGAFGLANTNKMIKTYDGANGIKTGSTGLAGYCLSASAKRDGMQLIAVVLGSQTSDERFSAAKALLDYGFANFAIAMGTKGGESVGEIAIQKGMQTAVKAVTAKDFSALVQKGKQKEIERQIELVQGISAPVAKGEKVGEIKFLLNGEKLGSVDIVAQEKVDRITYFKVVYDMMELLLKA